MKNLSYKKIKEKKFKEKWYNLDLRCVDIAGEKIKKEEIQLKMNNVQNVEQFMVLHQLSTVYIIISLEAKYKNILKN